MKFKIKEGFENTTPLLRLTPPNRTIGTVVVTVGTSPRLSGSGSPTLRLRMLFRKRHKLTHVLSATNTTTDTVWKSDFWALPFYTQNGKCVINKILIYLRYTIVWTTYIKSGREDLVWQRSKLYEDVFV